MTQLLKPSERRWRFSPAKIFLIINLSVIIAIFIVGFNPDAFKHKITAKDLASHNGKYLTFIGRVCEEADVSVSNRRLTICAAGRTLVTTDLYPVYDYGDWLKISGQLQAPPQIDGFDYENYLARYDIYSVMYYPKIELAAGRLSVPQKVYKVLINFKQRLKAMMDSSLPEPEAGLADALLLGYNRTVDRDDLNIFSRVGLSHMIAISGSHITILSAMIINFFLALGFSRRRSLLIIFAFLIFYPLITGLAASAVRSAIMGGLAFLAVYHGRSGSIVNALFFSGAIMLVINPQILRADLGFQLSFLAVLGIIYLYPLGEKLYERFLARFSGGRVNSRTQKIIKSILDTVNLTLVSQIMTLPILLINFQRLSLISPLANILVLWTFPLVLSSLIIGLFIAAIFPAALWPLVGPWIFLPAYLLLKFMFVVSDLLASPSWAAFNVNWFNWYHGAAYYSVLALFIFCSYRFCYNRSARINN